MYLVAHNLLCLLIVQRRHRESALVLRIHVEVDLAEMRKVLVEGIWPGVFSRDVFIGGHEAPSCVPETPISMGGYRDDQPEL